MSEQSIEKLAAGLRELLGIDVQFEKLSKEELIKLWTVTTNMSTLAQVGVKNLKVKAQGQVREALEKPLKELLNTPRLLKEGGLLHTLTQGEGILGLGIFKGILGEPHQEKPKEESGQQSTQPSETPSSS